jgi:cobalamin biosynthesis protein CobT
MSKSYIKKFESFQLLKRKFEKANEAVVQFEDKYKVGGIEVAQSLINSYVKKVKQDAGKNLRQLYSDMEIAELLVKYVANTKLDVDRIPATALLGGTVETEEDMDMDTETSTDMNDGGMVEEPEATEPVENAEEGSEEEVKLPEESEEGTEDNGDEFGEPTSTTEEETEKSEEEKKEGEEETEEESTEETEEESGEENEELPI